MNVAEFDSEYEYDQFKRLLMRNGRSIHTDKVRGFLKKVVATSVSRILIVKAGEEFYRAQAGCDVRSVERRGYRATSTYRVEVPTAFCAERMHPKAEFVRDGRANPSGTPYLYMATTPKTAMAEVRPWLGSQVSLARFKVVRDLRLVDCTRKVPRPHRSYGFRPVTAAEREACVWDDISAAFSTPVARDQQVSDYAPTQVIATAFRAHEHDGIMYDSLLEDDGKNLVLFDPTLGESATLQLFETTRLDFAFKPREAERSAKETEER